MRETESARARAREMVEMVAYYLRLRCYCLFSFHGHRDTCVECLFFKVAEPSPLQDSLGVRQKGGLPGPPPVVPDSESLAA